MSSYIYDMLHERFNRYENVHGPQDPGMHDRPTVSVARSRAFGVTARNLMNLNDIPDIMSVKR